MVASSPVDVSNSHLALKTERPVSQEVGIDTWRLVRYLSDHDTRTACAQCPGGRHPVPIAGHRVGVIPGHRMLWIEGHPAVDGLAAPRALATAEERVLDHLADAGLPLGTDAGIGRLDQTVTLRFDDPRQGQVFMAGVAAVDVPRVKPAVYGRPPETVYLLAERSGRKLARIYDKGLESRSAERGQLVRLENQTRFPKGARMSADTYSRHPTAPAALFTGRFAPLALSCDGLTAGTFPVLAEAVAERVRAGEITMRQAERLVGFLVLAGNDIPGHSPATNRRRRAELREQGLVLADPLTDPIDVDLGEALAAALAAWSGDGT